MIESPARPVGKLEAWLVRWPAVVLVLLCLVAWLPGVLSLPPLDRDESRFAQASKQMIESGDYVDIRFGTASRYNKPVGVYWAQAAATRLLGSPPFNRIWTYRIPSLVGGILAVLLTYWCGRAFAPPSTAFLGSTLLALTVSLSAEAEIATTDALLLASIVAAQGFLLRLYLRARERVKPPSILIALACWAAVGAGLLLKGPVILAVLGVTVGAMAIWDRDWRWLSGVRPIPGLVTMLAVVLPWAIAIALASHGAFYQRSLGHDFAAKILGGQESHGAPPGYYLALAPLTLWPITLFVLPAIRAAIAQRAEPAVRFLLAWTVPVWLLFELVPTKLPHYILPVYPAICIMTAVSLTGQRMISAPASEKILRIVGAIVYFGVSVALAVALVFLGYQFGSAANILPIAIASTLLIFAVTGVAFYLRRWEMSATVAALATAMFLYPLVSAGEAPGLDQLWMSRTLSNHLEMRRRPYEPPAVLAGYVEPSSVFLLGTGTRLQAGKGAAEVAAPRGGLALIEDHERAHFLEGLHAAGAHEHVIDQISGFNYSRGRHEHITFYRITPASR